MSPAHVAGGPGRVPPPPEPLSLDDAMRLVRRLNRRRARRYGPTKGRADLPELDALELRALLPTSARPPAREIGHQRSAIDYYRPDGSVIDLPHPENAIAYTQIDPRERIVARTTRYRHGVRLWIATSFLGLDHNYTGYGPPILWETMVYHGGTRRNVGEPVQCWRYAARDAALAGHRQIVHTLDMTHWPRRRALAARVLAELGRTVADVREAATA